MIPNVYNNTKKQDDGTCENLFFKVGTERTVNNKKR